MKNIGAKQYTSRHLSKRTKKTVLSFGLLSVIGFVFFLAMPVSAEVDASVIKSGILEALININLYFAKMFVNLAIFELKFFITIAAYNDYINADVVRLGWQVIRDFANMFFIVILMVIAFGTILGLEQYEWKKTLTKLVFAAIFVNFSNSITQLIIDIAQVFTITFLNAVASVAGGNLLKMFSFSEIFNMIQGGGSTADENLDYTVFIGTTVAVIFAFTTMLTLGAYLWMLIQRLVVLWICIVLSPLAFIFGVLQTTKSAADDFWKEFLNHVLVAPIMVFFLYLAFASFGGGDGLDQINRGNPYKLADTVYGTDDNLAVANNAAATWPNLANYFIALGFMWLGIERVQKLGTRGADMVGKAKAVGLAGGGFIAGFGVAKWAGRKTKELPVQAFGAVKGKAWGVTKGAGKWAGKEAVKRLGGAQLRRAGLGIAERYTAMRARSIQDRSQRAKDIEEKIAKGDGNWKDKIQLFFAEPAERAMKRGDQAKETMEIIKQVTDMRISTGGTSEGDRKTAALTDKIAQEALKTKKFPQKTAEVEQVAMGLVNQADDVAALTASLAIEFIAQEGDGQLDLDNFLNNKKGVNGENLTEFQKGLIESQLADARNVNNATDPEEKKRITKEMEKQARNTYTTQGQEELVNGLIRSLGITDTKEAAKKRKSIDTSGGFEAMFRRGEKYGKIEKASAKGEAVSENERKKKERRTAEIAGRARDAIAKKEGRPQIHKADQVRREIQNASADYEHLKAANFAHLVPEAIGRMAEGVVTTDQFADTQGLLNAMRKYDAEVADDVEQKILERVGFVENINKNDDIGLQRRKHAITFGEVLELKEDNGTYTCDGFRGEDRELVQAQALDAALKRQKERYGAERVNAYMQQARDTEKALASEGYSAAQGTTIEGYDAEIGTTMNYTIAAALDESGWLSPEARMKAQSKSEETQLYRAERVDFAKITGIDGMMNADANGSSTFHMVDSSGEYIIDEEGNKQLDASVIRTLSTAANSLTYQSKLNPAIENNIRAMFESDTQGFIALLESLRPEARERISRSIDDAKLKYTPASKEAPEKWSGTVGATVSPIGRMTPKDEHTTKVGDRYYKEQDKEAAKQQQHRKQQLKRTEQFGNKRGLESRIADEPEFKNTHSETTNKVGSLDLTGLQEAIRNLNTNADPDPVNLDGVNRALTDAGNTNESIANHLGFGFMNASEIAKGIRKAKEVFNTGEGQNKEFAVGEAMREFYNEGREKGRPHKDMILNTARLKALLDSLDLREQEEEEEG